MKAPLAGPPVRGELNSPKRRYHDRWMRYTQLRAFKKSVGLPDDHPLTPELRERLALLIGRSVKQVERTEELFADGPPERPTIPDEVYVALAANKGNRAATHAQLGEDFGKRSYDAFCDWLVRVGDPAVLVAARYGTEALKYWIPTKERAIPDPLELYTQDTLHLPMRLRVGNSKATEDAYLEMTWSPGARMQINFEVFVGSPTARLAAAVFAGALTGVGSGDPAMPRIGGVCDTALTDRASIYLGEEWRRLTTGTSVIAAYGKPHVPQEKADEERRFGTIQQSFLNQLAGYLGSRFPAAWIGDREGSLAHRVRVDDLPSVEEVRLAIVLWMDASRATQVHPAFGTTCLARWASAAAPRARFLDPALVWDFAIPDGSRVRQQEGIFHHGYREPIPADPERPIAVRDVVCVRYLPGPRTIALFGDARERYLGYAPFHADLTEAERVAADARNALIGRDGRRILRLAREQVASGSRIVADAVPGTLGNTPAAQQPTDPAPEPVVGPRKNALGKRLSSRGAALQLAKTRVR